MPVPGSSLLILFLRTSVPLFQCMLYVFRDRGGGGVGGGDLCDINLNRV
jgi:hypothetical protein